MPVVAASRSRGEQALATRSSSSDLALPLAWLLLCQQELQQAMQWEVPPHLPLGTSLQLATWLRRSLVHLLD
jgi:hypothetical protein